MTRASRIKLSGVNAGKLAALDSLMTEVVRVINLYIDQLWEAKQFRAKFVDAPPKCETWLSARMLQCVGKQALEIVKSQRKRKKKTKPVFKRQTINLDSRFVDIRMNQGGAFDTWIRLSSIGGRTIVKLPSICAKHKHLNKFLFNGWELAKSVRLLRRPDGYYIDLIFKKDNPEPAAAGETIGFDCGYKKLLADSDGNIHDVGLEQIYEKISRKRKKSKAYYRALKERDNATNQSVNLVNLDDVEVVKVENLKNIKKRLKRKLKRGFNNKLRHWSPSKVLKRLQSRCEIMGIPLYAVNASYTSQTCSCCGAIHANSRRGESFACMACEMKMDADINAAINISRRTGVIVPVP